MSHFRDEGFITQSFNFSGHGIGSIWPSEFRIDLFARDLEKFFKDHGTKEIIVVGHSMGGYVAIYHKANYEDSPISHIFTYGTKFNWSAQSVAKEIGMLDPVQLVDKFPHVVETLKGKHGDRWKSLLHSTAHMMQHLEKLDGLTRDDTHEIQIPVTLIVGDLDRMVSKEETEQAASWLHYGKVLYLSHSKHELERSNLKELALMIIEEMK